MGDLFGQLAGTLGRAQDIARQRALEDTERQQHDQDRQIQQAAMLAGLQSQGIDTNAGTDPSDAQALGKTGYFLHPSRVTPAYEYKHTDQGIVKINKKTGESSLVMDANGKPLGAKTFAPPAPKEIKRQPFTDPTTGKTFLGYVAPNGEITDDDYNVVRGAMPDEQKDKGKSPSEIPGTPEWAAALRTRLKMEAEFRPEAKPAAAGGGMGSLTPEAIAGMTSQAADADAIMRKFEAKYGTGHASVGVLGQSLGAGTGAHATGMTAPVAGMVAGGSNALLGATNPEYQQYLAAQKRFGNIMGNLMSKRYTEYQGTLDTQLAGIAANDAGPTIQLKQSFRKELLDALHKRATPSTTDTPGNIDLNAPPKKKAGGDYGIFGRPE